MKVLALDAALNHSGYVVCDGKRIVKVAKVTIKPTLPIQEKLLTICRHVIECIFDYDIERIVLEGCYNARNAKTAYKLSLVHGAIMAVAGFFSKEIEVIPPSTVKKLTAGRGHAGKEEIARSVLDIYADDLKKIGMSLHDIDSDITDALAVYHADLVQRSDHATHKKTS